MKHSKHRNQMAQIKRSMYQELRADDISAKAARMNVNTTIKFLDSLQRIILGYNYTATIKIDGKRVV
ncbi:hypothetical protein LCGC14_2431350 [marine sediment metagenome]|uniref:Uncharacterized protein n=1 Tax=marine sediment metagenome TaxID=412755 RepID=A0A0F9BLW8_9ZZZZ